MRKARGEYKKRPIGERFWSKVDRSGGPDACWPWTASRRLNGYGQFGVRAEGKDLAPALSHRVAYELTNGLIPDGMHICHSCDNPPCCNPAHLWAGSRKDNMTDCSSKGRVAKNPSHGEANGNSKLTEDDVRHILELRKQGLSQHAISRAVNVPRPTIKDIVTGFRWRHIPRD